MQNNRRTILIVAGVLVAVCCIGAAIAGFFAVNTVSNAFVVDPARAEEIGQGIAQYEAPDGTDELFAMDLAGVRMVALGDSSGSSVYMLMAVPAGTMTQEQMTQQMQQALNQNSSQQQMQMEIVGSREVTIGGQAVTLTISEGSREGVAMRQEVGGFTRADGNLVMVFVVGPVAAWDEARNDAFYESIR